LHDSYQTVYTIFIYLQLRKTLRLKYKNRYFNCFFCVQNLISHTIEEHIVGVWEQSTKKQEEGIGGRMEKIAYWGDSNFVHFTKYY
jgi:uncharacterized CHY-type Zn-finger protein